MREVKKPTVQSFVEYIISKYFEDSENYDDKFDFEGVNIVAKYDVIMPILNELIKESPFMLISAELNDYSWDGYDDEFVLTINHDGEVYVEKVYVEEKDIYLNVGGGLTFLHNDCNSKFLKNNEDADVVAFEITDDPDDESVDDSDDESLNCTCDSEDTHGFHGSFYDDDGGYHSVSFYSTDSDLVRAVLKSLTE